MTVDGTWAWTGPTIDGWTVAAAVVVGVVAVAVVLPRVVTSSRSLQHRPRLALALWTGWGTVLGVVPVAIPVWLVVHVGSGPVWDTPGTARPTTASSIVAAALAATTMVATWVVLRVVHTISSRRRALVRHLRMVELVGTWDPHVGAVVIDADPVAAYCVPGVREGAVILTSGVVASADESELVAVVEHERAHARGRHGLLVMAFLALQRAVPFSRTARLAVDGVITATEMIADEAAARSAGCGATIRALHLFDRDRAADGGVLPWGEVPPAAHAIGRDVERHAAFHVWVPERVTLTRVRRLLTRAQAGAC